MRYELLHHKLAYLILCLGLALLTIVFLAVWPDRVLQRMVSVAIALFYFSWGTVTHLHTTQLTKRVMYEYASMSFLAAVLLLLVTL